MFVYSIVPCRDSFQGLEHISLFSGLDLVYFRWTDRPTVVLVLWVSVATVCR